MRCVYCDVHENDVGGREAMQIDHFRPHSRPEFKHLKNDPKNFHHSCVQCNNTKRANWPSSNPNASHDGAVGFVDPFNDNRLVYFDVSPDGELCARHPVGTYLICLFKLNRPFLSQLRKRHIYRAQLESLYQARKPEWEAAAQGKGTLTLEALAKEVGEFERLVQLVLPDYPG